MEVNQYRVYYVDPEEQVNFYIHEIGRHAGGCVAFVIHPRASIFASAVNLDLIRSAAKKHGVEVVFISSHPHSAYILKEAGFSVFNNLAALEKREGGGKTKKKPPHKDGVFAIGSKPPVEEREPSFSKATGKEWLRRLLVVFFVTVFLLTTIQWLLLQFPPATIEVRPALTNVEREVVIRALKSLTEPNWEQGLIPLETFNLLENLEKDFPVRGTKKKGRTPARCKILVFNDGEKPLQLAAGTQVIADCGWQFATLASVTIPPRQVEKFMELPVGLKAGQVEMEVVAVQPGAAGNVPAGAINAFTDEHLPLYVVNPAPAWGGQDETVRVVNEEDVLWAHRQMEADLRDEFFRVAYRRLSGEYRIIEETLQIESLEITFQQEIGQEAGLLQGRGTIGASVNLVDHRVLDQMLTYLFLEDNPTLQRNYSLRLQAELQAIVVGEDEVVFSFNVNGMTAVSLDPKVIAGEIAGTQVDEAKMHLAAKEDIQSFDISLPEGGTIPRLPLAIRVVIRPPL